jgi:carbamoyltransferase
MPGSESTAVLGLSCHYHDSAACLMVDGEVVAAAQEERFNRQKHCPDFPVQAINYCVESAGLTFDDLDHVVFYEKPYLKLSRVVVEHLRSFPFSFRNFLDSIPDWLADRLAIPLVLRKELGYEGSTLFLKHHLSHAASTYLVSPFDEAAILTADGVGEWACATLAVGRGSSIEVLEELHYPNSVGLLYTALTTFLGFRANGGEGKLMGLAAYGEPRFRDELRQVVRIGDDGSFGLDDRYFGFNRGRSMFGPRLVDLLGPAREPEGDLEQRHYDLAASVQELTEELLIGMARRLHDRTGLDQLCLAGGVFLNCLTNHRILEHTPFERVFVQPAAGDAGGAIGAAAYVQYTLQGNPRRPMEHAYLGPGYTPTQVRRALINANLDPQELPDEELFSRVAGYLADDKVVGWFQGRMEFGPRALGNRSILGNPCSPQMQDILNERIKKRESFRPFAPVVRQERASEYFDLLDESPFMLLAPTVKPRWRSRLPAITHVDGTSRVQGLAEAVNPRLHALLGAFEERAGVPMLVNTSFNQRGEPVVCTPRDAVDCFQRSRMDVLVMENFVVERGDV